MIKMIDILMDTSLLEWELSRIVVIVGIYKLVKYYKEKPETTRNPKVAASLLIIGLLGTYATSGRVLIWSIFPNYVSYYGLLFFLSVLCAVMSAPILVALFIHRMINNPYTRTRDDDLELDDGDCENDTSK